MTTPRMQAFRPAVHDSERAEGNQNAESNNTQFGVRSHLPNAPIYGGDGNGQNQGGDQGSNTQECAALADALERSNTGTLRNWANRIAQKAPAQAFPSDSPMQFIGDSATPASFSRNSKSELNRRAYGDYRPYIGHQKNDATPLSGQPIQVEGRAFNAATANAASDIPDPWKQDMLHNLTGRRMNMGAAGGASANQQLLALGRYTLRA